MKPNIVRGGGGRIVELRGEIGLKCSKIAKCLNTFVAHCLKMKNRYLRETIHCVTWIQRQDVLISHMIMLLLFSVTWARKYHDCCIWMMMSQRCKTADELGKMVFKARISSDTRAYVHLAKEWKSLSAKQIIQRLHISRASLYHILKEDKIREDNQERQKEKNIGRPRKLGAREKRLLLREIPKLRKSEGKFTVKQLTQQAGVSPRNVSRQVQNAGHRSQVTGHRSQVTENATKS